MIDIALEQSSSDLSFNQFDFSLVDGIDQIRQNLFIRLKFILGEWFLDINEGVPYYEDIFLKNPNQIIVENVFKQEIINTRGIEEILTFESDFNREKRIFYVNFSVRTISGQELEQEFELPV